MIPLLQPTESAHPPAKGKYRSLFSLGSAFWTFFSVAFFFDAGFAVYFFLFNLYLLDAHWSERSIGVVVGACMLGSTLATLPAGEMARRFGLRRLLFACIVSAPLLGTARALWLAPSAQITLAFFAGAAMSLWGVGYLPAIARIVSDERRPAAYSLVFTASVITSAVGAALSGFLAQWTARRGVPVTPLHFKRMVLVIACGVAMLAAVPLVRLRIPAVPVHEVSSIDRLRSWQLTPFLRRYLLCMALWTGVIAAFAPFSNLYLARQRHLPLHTIAILFSSVQILQLILGVAAPYLLRALGLHRGLLLIQIFAGAMLVTLALAPAGLVCGASYVAFSAAQWMSLPALYSILMNETPVTLHENAAAMTLFVTALIGTIATPIAGVAFSRFGYPRTLLALSGIALATAMLFFLLRQTPTQPAASAELCPSS